MQRNPNNADLVRLARIAPAKFMIEHPTTCPNCGQTFETLGAVISHQGECQNESPAERYVMTKEAILGAEFQKGIEDLSMRMAAARDEMMKRIIRLAGYEPDPSPNAEWREHISMVTLGTHGVGFRQAIYIDGKVNCYIDERLERTESEAKMVLQVVAADDHTAGTA